MPDNEELTISVPEAGRRYFGLTAKASYRYASLGKIPVIRLGGLLRVPVRAMDAMLNGVPLPDNPQPKNDIIDAPAEPTSERTLRRFTPEEDDVIRRDYAAYVPTQEIAWRLERDEGTVRQRILHLNLRRSMMVSLALRWAPQHLKERLPEMPADEFLAACATWREEENDKLQNAEQEQRDQRRHELQQIAADIDMRRDLSRNQKMILKRSAGMTLESVAQQHGLTRERVRQLTDPNYVACPKKAEDRLERWQQRQHEYREKQIDELFKVYNRASVEAQEEFIRRVTVKTDEQASK
jgi:hypothetical protein